MNTISEENNSKPRERTTSTKNLPYRLLFVDDNQDILFTIQNGLESYGFLVDTFSNPSEALSSFKPELYDLV